MFPLDTFDDLHVRFHNDKTCGNSDDLEKEIHPFFRGTSYHDSSFAVAHMTAVE
jgi:hypothetical protein